MKIMFVCTGNICRSPLAEAVFHDLSHKEGVEERFEVDSSGTTAYHVGQQADDRMRSVAASRGVEIRHRSKQLIPQDFDEHDLLLAMDRSNLREMRSIARNSAHRDKIRLFREFDPQGGPDAEVPDPYYGGRSGFEKVYDMVERTSRSLLSALLDRVSTRSS